MLSRDAKRASRECRHWSPNILTTTRISSGFKEEFHLEKQIKFSHEKVTLGQRADKLLEDRHDQREGVTKYDFLNLDEGPLWQRKVNKGFFVQPFKF